MQFIGTGNRILTENFNVGYLYTITFKTGIYINSACIGIGDTFVMFQKAEPDLLYTLNVDTADEVDTIELYNSGGGTNDYDDLFNRPQINSHTLTGNMSGADLGLQATIPDLDTIRAGAAAGATAVQPADMTSALAAKQDALSTAQLDAVNSGITEEDVTQIGVNKNNILLSEQANGQKNVISNHTGWEVPAELVATLNSDGSITVTANTTSNKIMVVTADLSSMLQEGTEYVLSGCDGGDFNTTYAFVISNSAFSSKVVEATGGTPFTANSTDHINLTLIVRGGQNWTKTFHPMICKKSLWEAGFTDYQPYAMSNAELTAKEQQNEDNISKLKTLNRSVRIMLSSTAVNGEYYGIYNFSEIYSVAPTLTLTIAAHAQGGIPIDTSKFSTNVYVDGVRVYTAESTYAGLIIKLTMET